MTEEIIMTFWRHVFRFDDWPETSETPVKIHSLPKFNRKNWNILLKFNATHLSCYLHFAVPQNDPTWVSVQDIKYKIELKGKRIGNGELVIRKTMGGDCFSYESPSWGRMNWITKEEFKKWDEFIIEVVIKEVFPSSNHLESRILERETESKRQEALIRSHMTVFDDAKTADVAFVFIDDSGKEKELYSHEAVLINACEYFKDMFSSGCLEGTTPAVNKCLGCPMCLAKSKEASKEPTTLARPRKRVVIKDATYQTYRAMLVFILSNKIEFNKTLNLDVVGAEEAENEDAVSAKSIYQLADCYRIDALREKAKEAILQLLTPENVAEEVFSEFSSDHEEIRKAEQEFLLSCWKTVIETPGWKLAASQASQKLHLPMFNCVQEICVNLLTKSATV